MGTISRIIEFHEYLQSKGYKGRNDLERKLDISQGYLTKQYKKQGDIGSDIVNKLCKEFPEISVEWLITGNGEMLKEVLPSSKHNHIEGDFIGGTFVGGNNSVKGNGNVVGSVKSSGSTKDDTVVLLKENKLLKAENKKLINEVESLKEKVYMLKGENRVLREQLGLGERKESSKTA